jgi:hypothetical protein
MPRAVIDISPEEFELKSCPGGVVKLRRMPYGDWLHRQELAIKMTVASSGKKGQRETEGQMVMANKAVTTFEFSRCIVEHNLEDENGNILDFKTEKALNVLDPRVGNEIGDLIGSLHEVDEGNSLPGSEPQ